MKILTVLKDGDSAKVYTSKNKRTQLWLDLNHLEKTRETLREKGLEREVVAPGSESVTGHSGRAGPPGSVGETLVLIDEDAVPLASYLLLQRQPRVLESPQRVLRFGEAGVEQLDGLGQLSDFADHPERFSEIYLLEGIKKHQFEKS